MEKLARSTKIERIRLDIEKFFRLICCHSSASHGECVVLGGALMSYLEKMKHFYDEKLLVIAQQ